MLQVGVFTERCPIPRSSVDAGLNERRTGDVRDDEIKVAGVSHPIQPDGLSLYRLP